MKTQLKDISETKKEIELEISSENARSAHQKALQQYASGAKIKGFRKGKVPDDIILRMYQSEIREAVINALVPNAVNEEIKSYNFKVASIPRITDLQYDEGGPIKVKAEIEIWPDFKMPDYKKIKLKKKKISVTENDVTDALTDIQTRSVQYIPTEERGVVDGDYVVVEIKGQDVETKRFLPTEKSVVLANHPDNEKQLNEHLLGLRINEETHFTIDYKKDHTNKKLAGKTVDYKVKILSIKEKKLPEINDDFAKDLGEFENIEDLKEKIKGELKKDKEEAQKRYLADELMKEISDNVKITLPDTMIEQEAISIIKRQMSTAPKKDLKEEDLKKMNEEAKIKAQQNIKNHLILTEVAKMEKLEVLEKEFQDELKSIAMANRVTYEQVLDHINKEGTKEDIMNNLLMRKTVDFLMNKVILE
jgi:trigger factor